MKSRRPESKIIGKIAEGRARAETRNTDFRVSREEEANHPPKSAPMAIQHNQAPSAAPTAKVPPAAACIIPRRNSVCTTSDEAPKEAARIFVF